MQKLKLKANTESTFDRQKLIGWWDQEALSKAKVMVIGAGAIGNEVIKNLALMGVGYLFIVDFDLIEKSNLSRTVLFKTSDIDGKKAEIAARQAEELALADNFQVDWFHGDLVYSLGAIIYHQFDLVLGCLDNVEARLTVNKHCFLGNIPWIDAGIRELRVRVNPYLPEHGVCYECSLTEEELNSAHIRYSCFNFKRDAAVEGKVPTTQIAASLAAAWQVQEGIKLLCGQSLIPQKYIYYQGTHHDFDLIGLNINPQCHTHNLVLSNYQEIESSHQITINQFFEQIIEVTGHGLELLLEGEDWSFVKSLTCSKCSQEIELQKPNYRIGSADIHCPHCDERNAEEYEAQNVAANITYISSISPGNAEYHDFTLEQLGFSAGAIVTVKRASMTYQFGLTGDVSRYLSKLN